MDDFVPMNDRSEVQVILGTMTFGGQASAEEAERIVTLFRSAGGRELDTARTYMGGRTEQILRDVLRRIPRESVTIATKANPSVTGDLGAESVASQLRTSLNAMGIPSVDIFYLHQPDLTTPIRTTLEACAKLHDEGLYRELGLSNYAAWQVADIRHICKRNGWPEPAVYQGMYNALTRDVERELFPCLRAFNMRFYAYNPLAGGLLSGKYRSHGNTPPTEGRFKESPAYADRYWKESYFTALDDLGDVCRQAGVTSVQAALRWLAHHSCLRADCGDGIILGATRLDHIEENITACTQPALPPTVVERLGAAWEIARPTCPKYFRP